MIHTRDIRRDSLHSTKNMLESLTFIIQGDASHHSSAAKKQQQSENQKNFFSNYFKRSEMRLRLGFLRRRSSESSLSARPAPEEAQKWSESFANLMASKYGAALYRAFLLREFSNENLEFWLACEDYKVSKPQKMGAKAQKIYNDFVAVQAPKEVNLDAETRLIVLTNVQSNNPDAHAFDRAQRRIQHMMERDSYLRFLQSELFLELVHPDRYSASNNSSETAAAAGDKSSAAP